MRGQRAVVKALGLTSITKDQDESPLDKYTLQGHDVEILVDLTLQPPIVTPVDGRHWFEGYVQPPRSKAICKKFRTAVLDAVLCILRAAMNARRISLVGWGEGGLALMATLSPELRKAAYAERRVPADEATRLEKWALLLEHAVLLAPHGFPLKSYLPTLREYVPELACVIPHPDTSVLVVSPTRDTASIPAFECAQVILGSVVESVPFSGPAYRCLPAPPLILDHLKEGNPPLPSVAAIDSTLPKEVAECWAGIALYLY